MSLTRTRAQRQHNLSTRKESEVSKPHAGVTLPS
jgi:hypothetical protein